MKQEKRFCKKVQDFKPDLILVSVLESIFSRYETFESVPSEPENIKHYLEDFATFASEKLIKNNLVDYVCRGEGEDAVMEMCQERMTVTELMMLKILL